MKKFIQLVAVATAAVSLVALGFKVYELYMDLVLTQDKCCRGSDGDEEEECPDFQEGDVDNDNRPNLFDLQ